MARTLATVITVAVLLGLLGLMLRSWRRRSRRDAALPAGYPLPVDAALELASVAVLYVATTLRARPLERLNIPGLGFRARARLTITEAGVILALAGEEAVFIPASAIAVLEDATVAIDRVVETDGLLLLGWRLPGVDGQVVDSYFRILDPSDRVSVNDVIRTIAADALRPAAHDESEA
ncbi:hypothetical protein E3T28_11320 [Cryobacterium sinapicolor]|uniref:PH domain-containing protein n=1 Tax=Cryobacterium sinapicolor TaxID=1259236 RepID=A0ABY2J354_9MICO|nr:MULTISPECIES: hypothetical protein [Cryobacterium]TFC87832.1 hypothetical protein E3O67_08880 [Cryobacterium sp. TMT3-29-2]TFC98188.1 hypothetical protein E3T28_11320 [Cryobacterium sinapicolor]